MMTEIVVITPGAFTTIQDLGRPGRRAGGVSPGGAADALSLRVANLLVGNRTGAAALEITLLGPRLAFPDGAWVALAGAELDATLSTASGDTLRLPGWHPVWVPAGSSLVCGGARRGCRAILAISGGIAVAEVLGGRGTDVRSGFGGVDGRPLRAGDRLPIAPPRLPPPADGSSALIAPRSVGAEFRPFRGDGSPVRVIRGPEFGAFNVASRTSFLTGSFTVTNDSDRMGCRLAGPELQCTMRMLSQPLVPGTIQILPSGQPILLLADAPTTGGYPRIAVVATIDMPLVAQARPGDRIRFAEISLPEAGSLTRDRERGLARLERGLEGSR